MVSAAVTAIYEDIIDDLPNRNLVLYQQSGATPEQLTQALIERVIELRAYPAYSRMTKLIHLRQFVMGSMGYGNTMLVRRIIAGELLEIACLPMALRVETMCHLGEACGPEDAAFARNIWRDSVLLAERHDCVYAAMSAVRHLEPVRQ